MIIEVTKDDIGFGARGFSHNCAIAQALKRYFPDQAVAVYPYFCIINGKDYTLPPSATAFIVAFDNNQPVSPLSFYLNTERKANERQALCVAASSVVS